MSQNVPNEISRAVADLQSDVDNYLPVEKIRKNAVLGDILEFQRGDYTDYALYLGEGKVMTFGLQDKRATEAKIQQRSLQEVCDEGKARVRNHEDVAKELFDLTPKEPHRIVKKAKTYISNTVPYEFDFRNSEYYCTLWRYGIGFSTQAAQQAWLPAESTEDDKVAAEKPRMNLFGPDGYAKYKQLSMSERGERSTDQY